MDGIVRITIGTPLGRDNQIDARTAAFCARACKNDAVRWHFCPTSFVELGRNIIVQKNLEDKDWGMSHLFFVDSDIVPPEDAVWKLWAMDFPIASGIYPMQKGPGGIIDCWSFRTGRLWWERTVPVPNKTLEATGVGGGCLLVQRKVFERIGWPWFQNEYELPAGNSVGLKTGEDVFFCKKARDAGFGIFVNPGVLCQHYHYRSLI